MTSSVKCFNIKGRRPTGRVVCRRGIQGLFGPNNVKAASIPTEFLSVNAERSI